MQESIMSVTELPTPSIHAAVRTVLQSVEKGTSPRDQVIPGVSPQYWIIRTLKDQEFDASCEEWRHIQHSYDRQSRIALECWLTRAGRLELLRHYDPDAWIAIRMINVGNGDHCGAIGFPIGRGKRGFRVIESDMLYDWARLEEYLTRCKAKFNDRWSSNHVFLASLLREAPCMFVMADVLAKILIEPESR
jgi:hypothetical protein